MTRCQTQGEIDMLLEPPIDTLVKKVGNPYKLAVLVSKRAKQIQKTEPEEVREKTRETTQAVNEVYNGRII